MLLHSFKTTESLLTLKNNFLQHMENKIKTTEVKLLFRKFKDCITLKCGLQEAC